ncbi:MAG: DNA-formamidopyrimidine glycosylase family protein, partial [candidate division WOR-3 bacterium]
MPELPEVETIKRELLTQLIGIKIIKVIILRPEIIGYPEPEQFVKILRQTEIEDIVRKAKYLIFKLSNQQQLIFHLRLSGSLIITDRSSKPRYSRIKFFLSNNRILHFTEPRLLGRVYLIRENCRPEVLKGFFTLGREPIARNFDLDYLQNIIANRKACIKSLLLDQRIAAGVGNIYSDEALFQAGIRPTRRASTLS